MRIERRARRAGHGVVGPAVVAVVLVVLAAACSKTSTPAAAPTTAPLTTTTTTTTASSSSAPAAPARPPTQWDAVEAHIGSDGQLDLAGTRLAFSLLFQPLPGVTLPTGAATSDLHSDGSMVARAVMAHWDDLSVADRRIMAPYFDPTGPGSTGLSSPGAGGSSTTSTGPTTATTRSRVRSTAPAGARRVVLASAIRTAAKKPDPAAVAWTSDQVWSIAQREAGLLGINPPAQSFFEVRFSSIDLRNTKGKKEDADMWTVVLSANAKFDPTKTKLANAQSGPAEHCVIFLSPHVWASAPTSGAASPGLTEQLAHEVFHCYQGYLIGTSNVFVFDHEPNWLIEGGAAWAGADLAQTNKGYEDWWDTWLQKTETPLFDRSYSAIGFYSTLQRIGGLTWMKWRDLFSVLSTLEVTDSAYSYKYLTEKVDGLGEAWAPAYARSPDWGADWDQSGIDIDQAMPKVSTDSLADGDHVVELAEPYTVAELDVNASSPVIVTVTVDQPDTHGVVRLHDAAQLDEIVAPSATFCLGGSCGCVKDGAGDPVGNDATGPVRIAISALDTGDAVSITAKANDQNCEVPPLAGSGGTASDPNSPGGSDCVGNCGASNGDPHLTTITGFHYEMQAVGEFVMLQSGPTAAGSPFELQARDVAHGPIKPVRYTCNLVIAMSFGHERITVTNTLDGTAPPVVRVDGKTVQVPITLDGGVKLVEDAAHDLTATAPDQITVIVRPLPEYGEHLLVEVPTSMVNSMHGLLAPDTNGAVPARDGHLVQLHTDDTVKGIHVRDEREYHDLVASWRVTQAESLFDYGPGQSTKTFTDLSVPDLRAEEAFPSKALLAAAAKVCAGVSPQWLRDECAYDVAATGDHGLVSTYKALMSPAKVGPTKIVGKVLHPGDVVPLHSYSGSVTYRLEITKTGFLDITFSVGCFGGFPGQVFDGHTVVVETITVNPLGTRTVTPETCDDQIGVPVLKTGIYTITFVSTGVKDAKTGFTISPIRQVQFTH